MKTVYFEQKQIKKEIEVLELLASKISFSDLDGIELRAAAVSLHSVYNGFEKVLIWILKDQKIDLPNGISWHSDILKLCKNEGIISEELETELRDYMAFRHYVRHSYSFMLKNDLIKPLLLNIEKVVDLFFKSINI